MFSLIMLCIFFTAKCDLKGCVMGQDHTVTDGIVKRNTYKQLAAINPPLLELPLYIGKVSAGRTTGFASPAQDYEQERLDLNKKLVTNVSATFFYYVGKSDDSMLDDGIMPGGLLIVDRSKESKSGRNVVAIVDGEYVVKRLFKRNGIYELRSMNKLKNYSSIQFNEGTTLEIEGVVTHVVNSL